MESTAAFPTEAACELSFVMPCLNEAETLALAIATARRFLTSHAVAGEIIVADNGSTDGSADIARGAGARVVTVEERGYGNSLIGGIRAARGESVIIGDPDGSYDFGSVEPLLAKLREGYDLVIGNRFQGGVLPGAMPALNRFVGNPLLSSLGRLFYRSGVSDFHCGLRGFKKTAIEKLDLQTTGMEFASEMIVKATLLGMRIGEVPTTLHPDGRSRPPHLRPWRDGWRHLRFLLLYSPRWLFFYPGFLLMLTGVILGGWLTPGMRTVHGVGIDVHTLLYCAVAIEIGFQAILFALFTRVFATSAGLLPRSAGLDRLLRWLRLEIGLVVGGIFVATGFALSIAAVDNWRGRNFGALNPTATLRLVIPASLLLSLGFEIVLASFFLGILMLGRRSE
ncbi:MAG: glycosyltransferase family 2 protein [Acidobacteriota bacterium]|nr:glycosyltransferase family 2 protein [Acidobacteriota bacterium]